ncbi:MAG: amidohydrolase family protein [Acidimicrobiales bacterium]
MATRGGASCLGRDGEIGQLAVGLQADIAVWPLTGPLAGRDLVEGWFRCGPLAPRHTIVAGQAVVTNGELVSSKVDEMLRTHRSIAERFQAPGPTATR